ncbi:MAG: DUF177 domain-containing protein [Candidatus Omnitrophota bacterium]
MRIHLNQIPDAGLTGTDRLNAASYPLKTEELEVVSPLDVSYRLKLEGGNLLANFAIRCRMRFVCSRCLTPYETPFSVAMDLTLPVDKEKVIDVTEDIRQEMLLEVPMKPLCQESCKGVCLRCGQNLNQETCVHAGDKE